MAGCTSYRQIYGNIYEGVRTQKEFEAMPGIDASDRAEQPPGYDEYLRQQQEATEKRLGASTSEALPLKP